MAGAARLLPASPELDTRPHLTGLSAHQLEPEPLEEDDVLALSM